MRLLSSGPAVSTAVAAARPQPGSHLRTSLALLTALAGGLALAAAFAPAAVWPLAAVGPALLTVALWQQRARVAVAASLVFGLAFFFPLLSWLVNVAWYVWTSLAVAEAVIFAVLAAGLWLLLRLRAWPVAMAGWWVAAEAIRDRWPWGGFPWGRLVMSQATAPTVRWVAIAGPPFLTFLIALAGGCLAWVLIGSSSARLRGQSPARIRLWPAVALAASALLACSGVLLPADQATPGGAECDRRGHPGRCPARQEPAGPVAGHDRYPEPRGGDGAASDEGAERRRARARHRDLAGEFDRPGSRLRSVHLQHDRYGGSRYRPACSGRCGSAGSRQERRPALAARQGSGGRLPQAPAGAVRRGDARSAACSARSPRCRPRWSRSTSPPATVLSCSTSARSSSATSSATRSGSTAWSRQRSQPVPTCWRCRPTTLTSRSTGRPARRCSNWRWRGSGRSSTIALSSWPRPPASAPSSRRMASF